MIRRTERAHEGKELTGTEMYRLVDTYWSDLGGLRYWDFPSYFDMVRKIPYESDMEKYPGGVTEEVARPGYLLNRAMIPKLDCKKKSILIGAWAKAQSHPFRFLAASDRLDKEVVHVFPQIDFGNGWVTVDATLPSYMIGQKFPITFAAELQR
jgi:hypothetical protein